jgi:hypothetical protein
VLVHELSHLAELTRGDAPEVDGGVLHLKADVRRWSSAEIVYPETRSLDLVKNGDTIEIALPRLSIHQLIRITYE